MRWYEPYFGYVNGNNVDTLKSNEILTQKNTFQREVDITYPSFFAIMFFRGNEFAGRVNFLIVPGDSLNIQFDLDANDSSWVLFSGDNAAGNNLFERINHTPFNKFIPVINLVEQLPNDKENLVNNVDKEIIRATLPFKKLLNEKKITQDFYASMTTTFRIFFYHDVLRRFLYRYKQREKVERAFRDSVISEFFKRQPATDSSVKALYLSNLYRNSYYRFLAYKKYNLESGDDFNERDSIVKMGQKVYKVDKELVQLLYISDTREREDQWAMTLMEIFEFSKGYLDSSALQQFEQIFPNSKWMPLLKKSFALTNQVENVAYVLQTPINYLKNGQLTSLDKIGKEFSGEAVYVDIWASWCHPCISAFSYNTKLDSFLLKNSIKRLYISLDKNEKAWLDAVDKYKLGGYHFLGSELLVDDLKRFLGLSNEEALGIPVYLLINKAGKIIDISNIPPSAEQIIFKKIIELL